MALALAVGGMTSAGCNKSESGETPGQKVGAAVDATTRNVGDAASKVGAAVSPTGADGVKGARNAVQGVVEKAATTNDFNDVAGYLTKADEDRIKAGKPDTKDLDAAIDQFNNNWNGKYGHKFKIADANADYPDSFIHFAPDSADANRLAGTIAASHGMAEVQVPFVREGSLWKIDVPDDEDGPKLHDNLLAAFTALNGDSANWPSSEVDATQAVTHHIISAVLNKK